MNRKLRIGIAGALFAIALCLVYSNHFDNGFYFDDSHTILNNGAIQSLDNLSSFFLDASTFSSLPMNRAYRPMVTTLNAISYQLGGGLEPDSFHMHMFFWYVVQLILLFFVIQRILNLIIPGDANGYLALAATVFYGFHTANAETINYHISISDSFSTLCIVATILLFQNKDLRKYYLYLIPMVVGIYTKQTGLMVVPILALYVLLFEEEAEWPEDYKTLLQKILKSMKKVFPAIFIGVNLFLFNQLLFTPQSTVSLNEQVSKFQYFYTQFFIVVHYLRNFILPNALSADPDYGLIQSFFDLRIAVGLTVILLMLMTALWGMKRRETRGITFGILWFFIALLPTSSFIPLYQIANDHRTFFPYIGLVIALINYFAYLFSKYEVLRTKYLYPIVGLFLILIAGHSYGVRVRNDVWNTAESLWKDVTIKSPRNARGLMNYGLALMSKGEFKQAEDYFMQTMKLAPNYAYVHINLGILKNAMGELDMAENYFRAALDIDPTNPECYYYYANWLNKQGRKREAYRLVRKGLEFSTNHAYLKTLYQQLSVIEGIENKIAIEESSVSIPAGLTEDEYLNLSLEFYQSGNMEGCIKACYKALEINPRSFVAYNNICSSFNRLKQWDRAVEACEKALEINPNFERARNNLTWARQQTSN